ncbi:MAG: GNAT family N-acetyltransferase [Alphaproteobacteria bacterium]|nr:GNAT family N-acetyltransferase [Alphaproteobacteria bacterium]
MDMRFSIVDYGSDAYEACVVLREDILRRPLGLVLTPEERAMDVNAVHVAGILSDDTLPVVATLCLLPQGAGKVKMRQVAVHADMQGKNLGGRMMDFCDNWAQDNGYSYIFCHARAAARKFYERHGYRVEGTAFDEQGIPHFYMYKNI